MPSPPKPAPAASKATARRVRLLSATYASRQPGPDGKVVEVLAHGNFGDEIVLDPREEMRLDSLGALAPPGATLADVESERARRIEAYRSARKEIAA
jgi:hypothetical protein